MVEIVPGRKRGLESLDVFDRINKNTYLELRCSGRIGKALPSTCVLVIKHDKDSNPVRAKPRIVVLGNYEDRVYEKSERYAPVLKYSSLHLLAAKAVRAKRVLQHRVTVRMPSAMQHSQKTNLQLSARPLVILVMQKMNTGS
jgi:hypothetical protein